MEVTVDSCDENYVKESICGLYLAEKGGACWSGWMGTDINKKWVWVGGKV